MAGPRLTDYTQQHLLGAGALDYCRWLQCLTESGGPQSASALFLERFPRTLYRDGVQKGLDARDDDWFVTKAAVAPGLTTDPSWAGALVGAPRELTQAFIGFANQSTLLGRIPGLVRAPFGVPVPILTAGATYGWVGQAKPKALSAMAFATTTIPPAKSAGTIVVTEELLKASVPGSAEQLRAVLTAGLASFLDRAVTDPAIAAVAGLSPASWTNGALTIAGTGNAQKDVAALVRAYLKQPYTPINPVLLVPWDVAAALDPEGRLGLGVDTVGRFAAMPAIASAYIDVTVLADMGAIPVADAGAIGVDVARQAMVEMVTPPTDPPTAATVLTSLWSTNQVGIRAERLLSWSRPIPASVAYLTQA